MATKNKTTSRTGTAKKTSKTKSVKSASRRPAAKEADKSSDHSGAALGLLAASLILLALVFIKGAFVWEYAHNFLFGLFSFYSIVLPILLLLLAGSVGLGKQMNNIGFRLGMVFLTVILLCSITQNFAGGYPEGSFWNLLQFVYQSGANLKGGGVASLLIGYPLTLLCGKEAALVVMFILLFVVLMVLTGTSVGGVLRFFQKIPRAIKSGVEESYAKTSSDEILDDQEKHQEQRELRKQQKHLEKQQKAAEKEAKRIEAQKQAKNAPKPVEDIKAEKLKTAKDFLPEPEFEVATESDGVEDLIHKLMEQQEESKSVNQPQIQEAIQSQESTQLPVESGEPASIDIEVEQIQRIYEYPSVMLLKQPKNNGGQDVSEELRINAGLLVETLESFGVKTKLVDISRGPTVTRYELQPAAGVKISKVTGLADDIALNLAAAGVRIEAPIPNKAAIGIEVPNKITDVVTIREIIDTPEFNNAKSKLTVALGKDIAGNVVTADLSKMPHTLIAGATGSGKSVCINSLLISILYKADPSEVRLLLVDPKVVELGIYNGIPHLLVPVVTDPRKAAGALQWAVTEMLKRYNEFADKGVRDIKGFNALAETRTDLEKMPQIVIIIDELADLMMAAPSEVEDSICRLAQMARAAGMYLVIATQRPSVDVITGIIKANIPSRIAFAVSSQVDSRTILDSAGAEKLLGKGDMLFAPSGAPKPTRLQGCFVSDKEVEEVVRFVSGDHQVYDSQIMDAIEQNAVAEKGNASAMSNNVGADDTDPLFEQAVACVVEAGQASTSYIQRKLKVGYARAARLMDEMEEKGIVGPSEGSKPRQILRTSIENYQ